MGYWMFLGLLLVCSIFSGWASMKVHSAYSAFSVEKNASRMTGYDTAVRLLRANGVSDVSVGRVKGRLTDHFDPRRPVVNLSDATYGDDSVAAVAVAGDIDHIQLMACDYPVQVGIDKVLARHRAPVAHQGALEVLGAQRLPQQRVVQQVELSGRQVVGGAPVGVQLAEHVGGQRALFGHAGGGFNDHLRLFLGGFCQSNDLLVSAFVLLIITDGTILSIEWGQNPS